MKTETKIAEENIKLLKQKMQTFETNARRVGLYISHKASCQRFLEFLKVLIQSDYIDHKQDRKEAKNKFKKLIGK